MQHQLLVPALLTLLAIALLAWPERSTAPRPRTSSHPRPHVRHADSGPGALSVWQLHARLAPAGAAGAGELTPQVPARAAPQPPPAAPARSEPPARPEPSEPAAPPRVPSPEAPHAPVHWPETDPDGPAPEQARPQWTKREFPAAPPQPLVPAARTAWREPHPDGRDSAWNAAPHASRPAPPPPDPALEIMRRVRDGLLLL
ncbi:hypothetical protein [Actinopolyspora halophila]|uniref:hypothetical protein n=1 Tax=Actinopolyspora halophila TaxID=1850 RepID=UPI000477ACF2|nr:hypothetical protein [Actinopolyspora halophila]